MQLWQLNEGDEALVEKLDLAIELGHGRRLQEIGLEKGQRVKCLKLLPFNGPRIFQISDSVFSLEKNLAEKVLIQKI